MPCRPPALRRVTRARWPVSRRRSNSPQPGNRRSALRRAARAGTRHCARTDARQPGSHGSGGGGCSGFREPGHRPRRDAGYAGAAGAERDPARRDDRARSRGCKRYCAGRGDGAPGNRRRHRTHAVAASRHASGVEAGASPADSLQLGAAPSAAVRLSLPRGIEVPTIGEGAFEAPTAPPPFGTEFTFDARGLVEATRDGALTPSGVTVYARRPAVAPVPRPFAPAPAADATPAVLPVQPVAAAIERPRRGRGGSTRNRCRRGRAGRYAPRRPGAGRGAAAPAQRPRARHRRAGGAAARRRG